MKKALVTAAVLGIFFVYGLYQKLALTPMTPQVTPTTAIKNTPETTIPETAANTSLLQPTNTPSPTTAAVTGQYKDGVYTGTQADAFYGWIQVQATISGGKITDVQFLQYPNDRSTSIEINSQAMPMLKAEAIQAQSAKVDIVSGATDSSLAFIQSLGSALQNAAVN